jgi:hypothetical protein
VWPEYWITLRCDDKDQLLRHLFTLRILDIIQTIKRIKINKTDSGGLAIVHFVISSNAKMYERLDWRKSAKR